MLVHDAVRPCIDAESLSRLREELRLDAVGGLLALPVVGTLKRADAEGRSAATEPREGLWSAQTPQMFRFGVLREALARPGAATTPMKRRPWRPRRQAEARDRQSGQPQDHLS